MGASVTYIVVSGITKFHRGPVRIFHSPGPEELGNSIIRHSGYPTKLTHSETSMVNTGSERLAVTSNCSVIPIKSK